MVLNLPAFKKLEMTHQTRFNSIQECSKVLTEFNCSDGSHFQLLKQGFDGLRQILCGIKSTNMEGTAKKKGKNKIKK